MKKKAIGYFLGFTAFIILFSACSSSKNSIQSSPTIRGIWILKTVSTEALNGKYTSRVFNEADYKCFIGSTWDFTPGNNIAAYTIDGMTKDCPMQKHFVNWSLTNVQDSLKKFQIKRLDNQKNPIDASETFVLDVTSMDKVSMQLKSNIVYEGHAAAIVYNFEKKK